jgi:hypothetical protein
MHGKPMLTVLGYFVDDARTAVERALLVSERQPGELDPHVIRRLRMIRSDVEGLYAEVVSGELDLELGEVLGGSE